MSKLQPCRVVLCPTWGRVVGKAVRLDVVLLALPGASARWCLGQLSPWAASFAGLLDLCLVLQHPLAVFVGWAGWTTP